MPRKASVIVPSDPEQRQGVRNLEKKGPHTEVRAKVLRQREDTLLSRKHQRGHSGRTQGEAEDNQDEATAASRRGES